MVKEDGGWDLPCHPHVAGGVGLSHSLRRQVCLHDLIEAGVSNILS